MHAVVCLIPYCRAWEACPKLTVGDAFTVRWTLRQPSDSATACRTMKAGPSPCPAMGSCMSSPADTGSVADCGFACLWYARRVQPSNGASYSNCFLWENAVAPSLASTPDVWTEHGVSHLAQAEVPGHKERFLVSPYGLLWNEVTASSLLVVDMVRKFAVRHIITPARSCCGHAWHAAGAERSRSCMHACLWHRGSTLHACTHTLCTSAAHACKACVFQRWPLNLCNSQSSHMAGRQRAERGGAAGGHGVLDPQPAACGAPRERRSVPHAPGGGHRPHLPGGL